jgi:hypothetical protein
MKTKRRLKDNKTRRKWDYKRIFLFCLALGFTASMAMAFIDYHHKLSASDKKEPITIQIKNWWNSQHVRLKLPGTIRNKLEPLTKYISSFRTSKGKENETRTKRVRPDTVPHQKKNTAILDSNQNNNENKSEDIAVEEENTANYELNKNMTEDRSEDIAVEEENTANYELNKNMTEDRSEHNAVEEEDTSYPVFPIVLYTPKKKELPNIQSNQNKPDSDIVFFKFDTPQEKALNLEPSQKANPNTNVNKKSTLIELYETRLKELKKELQELRILSSKSLFSKWRKANYLKNLESDIEKLTSEIASENYFISSGNVPKGN